ncbi:MAG: ATP-dependent Clp protease proteolytic subunit [Phycisphaerae bacterium]|jgi:membrane-bound serine protease (ClpP class)
MPSGHLSVKPERAGRLVVSGGLLLLALGVSSAPLAAQESAPDPRSDAQPQSVALIPITGEITDITRDSVARRFKVVREQGIGRVVLELNTPGGMVSSTLDICNAIRRLQDAGVKVHAWVNDKAYSGGAIIALAADDIIMAPNATIGDSQMIMMTPEGVGAVPEELEPKMTSPLYAELRDSARRNGYSLDLLLAFVKPEFEVFWVENTRTGERRFVNTKGRDELFAAGNGKDKERDAGEWRYVESVPGLGAVVQPIDGPNTLLTLRTVEARAYGLSVGTAGSETELGTVLNLPDLGGLTRPVARMDLTWLELVAGWLASPAVRGVLFLIMMLGAYAEFKTPGVGLPGGVALIALVVFLGAPYLAGFTVTWEIVVILLGILLLVIEAFVIPGFGVAGIAGLVLLGIGLVASFVPKELPGPDSGGWWPSGPLALDYLRRGLWALSGGTVGGLMGMYVLAKVMPRMPAASRLIAPNPTRDQIMVDDPYGGMARVGHIGRAEGVLRPAGKARFGALLVDVVSDGEFIPAGTRVEVVERAGSRVVVRRVD